MQPAGQDIETFCKLLGFEPSDTQLHYLLRVKNNATRLGMRLPLSEAMPIVATSMLWRALCFDVPSVCLTEFEEHGTSWVTLISGWMSNAHQTIASNIEVAQDRSSLVTQRGVRICQVVGPFTGLETFRAGMQDILLLDFDEIPSSRLHEALRLSQGALMYLPRFTEPAPTV